MLRSLALGCFQIRNYYLRKVVSRDDLISSIERYHLFITISDTRSDSNT